MQIGDAIEMLRQGERLSRKEWYGRGMYLELQVPDENSKMTAPYIYLTKNGQRIPWTASQEDLLAGDWVCLL